VFRNNSAYRHIHGRTSVAGSPSEQQKNGDSELL
jgi:hypothetical protein